MNDAKPASMGWSGVILIGALYAILMGGLVFGLVSVRRWAMETYVSPDEFEHWEQWRTEAERQAEEGPVKRRPPRSDIPPVLELTQEYFPQILTVSIILSSALFAASVYLFRGMIRSPGVIHDD